MRVAAVALVLIVGAAVVLAFANTLNSWVLGGLLGGLAAILISIPVSLALFTALARRHDARQQSLPESFEHEPEFTGKFYQQSMVYEAEGYVLPNEEDLVAQPRARYLPDNRRKPVSGYLPLPAAEESKTLYEDDLEDGFEGRSLRNYPRHPRHSSTVDEDTSVSQHPTQSIGSRRQQSTHSLSKHQSAALRKARQEALQQLEEKRTRHGSPSRRLQKRPSSSQRSRTSNTLRPPSPTTTGIQRPTNERDTWSAQQERVWRSMNEENDPENDPLTTDRVRDRYQEHYPRHSQYPRKPRTSRYTEPRTGTFKDDGENEQEEPATQRFRRAHTGPSGSIRNPLVRRAPYLYEDDPLREEFAQQLGTDPPITRRSSRSEPFEDDDEY